MKICYIQHVEFEGLGKIENYFSFRGDDIFAVRLYAGDALPTLDTFDVLVVMGGPMSANDTDVYAWLKPEKEFIYRAIEAKKIVLGICLGAQLIANVLGSKIYKNKYKEIGWLEIVPTEETLITKYRQVFAKPFNTFHWHGETFDLPKNSVLLCSSQACKNQAFSYGDNVLALQFHMEATEESIDKMLLYCKEDMTDGDYVQSEAEIISQGKSITMNNLKLFSLLDAFLNHEWTP